MCLGIVYNLSIWYKLSQHTQYGAIIALSGAATTILINVLFMPLYGYWAATWATFLAYLLMMVLSYIWGKRHYPIPYELKRIGTYILITLVVYALSYFTTQITSSYISLLLNNLFILSFAYLVYRIEIRNYESSN
jgi:O-antigen/teichoic acid export membrane protein